jgi:lactate racemase
MKITLAYGRSGLPIDVPDNIDILDARPASGLPDERSAIQDTLRKPIQSSSLRDKVRAGDKVVIVHTDITRATPNDRILPILLEEIENAGVARDDITLLNGLGTHRPQTENELRAMLGDEIVEGYRCIQHDCHDSQELISIGSTSFGNAVRINRTYLEADVRILTGFIEPHFFAGFSGGPKAVLPSLAGAESVFSNHGLAMIAHSRATWGITRGNPIWEEMLEVAQRTSPTFLLNVTLNSMREITGVYAGDMLAAHTRGIAAVKESAMVAVSQPYDIAITTNSGYPLDQNLYQSIKGLSAASQVVRPGGAIILAAACEDGLPEHGRYADLLVRGGSPQGVIDMISEAGFYAQDQWQVQIQAQIQKEIEVYVFSDGLTRQQIQAALFIPCENMVETLGHLIEKYGKSAHICAIPQGPQVIPYLVHNSSNTKNTPTAYS